MHIRPATADDWAAIEAFFRRIAAEGRTYAYPEDLTSEQARDLWMGQGSVVVAVEGDLVLGSATFGPNRAGRGSHIGTGSFMVDPEASGRGVGRALGEYVIAALRNAGYRGIQFNAVVETNEPAVHLWQALGFRIIGTVPGAFRHPEHGYVGLHVMHLPLV